METFRRNIRVYDEYFCLLFCMGGENAVRLWSSASRETFTKEMFRKKAQVQLGNRTELTSAVTAARLLAAATM